MFFNPNSRNPARATVIVSVLFTALVCLPASALPAPAKSSPILLAANAISMEQAVDLVRQKTGGRILSAKKVNTAEPVYVIKVLMPTGQVRSYRVSVQSGKIL